jgi:uncharacterized membrane protein (UPF0182 family)
MRRPQPLLFLIGLFFLLAVAAQVVPFYTDWLWFGEVGYTGVFWTTLSLRGTLFVAVMVGCSSSWPPTSCSPPARRRRTYCGS